MNVPGSTGTKYRVISVCGGYGFPISASAARIIMVGKALREAHIEFEVLHCGPSPIALNKQKSGVYDGIRFRYTTTVRRPRNKLARILVYAWALVGLTFRLAQLWPVRRSTLVYLYVMDGVLNLCTGFLCQLLGLPVVQELCEWIPDQTTSSVDFNKWLYRKRIFKVATGTLVISKAIEKRVRERCTEVYPHLLVHRVGVMVDAHRFATASPVLPSLSERAPNLVYCGTYLKDIFFLIRAFALVKLEVDECKLTVIGECGERHGPAILDYARKQGLPPEDVILTGCVDERTLEASYKAATALLMPLFNDDKSITRLPNKMGEYLASGRPVVTCTMGDLTDFLVDGVNAYVGRPGGERAFADKMIEVLRDPVRAGQIGGAGQQTCFAHLDYRAHVSGLSNFFVRCIECYNERASTQKRHEAHTPALYSSSNKRESL